MTILKTIILISWAFLFNAAQAQDKKTSPVFQMDYPNPTADKPQSKLWYRSASWWAILPRHSGPSLWQRTANGWKEHPEVNKSLQGVPGRADVWSDKDGVTAVGVSPDSLVVFRLNTKDTDSNWHAQVLGILKPPVKEDIETATIARDSKGEWWVAADGTNTVYVWHSADGKKWSKAILIKSGINKDDISAISVIKGAVIIIWSNQEAEAVQYKIHTDGQSETNWKEEGIAEAGNKTADDHLHATLTPDGTLWVVTKNSVDSTDYPQLVLRVRQPSGSWSNFPYMPREILREPSRPVIITTPVPGMLLAGHTVYNKNDKYAGCIEFGVVDTTNAAVLKNIKAVMAPASELKSVINDCTLSKEPFPANAPWIVLASDAEGQVYEVDLRRIFDDNTRR